MSRDGQFEAFGPQLSGVSFTPRVSPDGRYVAFGIGAQGEREVLVHDVLRGATNRLTQEGTGSSPAWHPNGRELAVRTSTESGEGIVLKDLNGAERSLVPGGDGLIRRNASWSSDGQFFAYTVQDGSQHDIWVLPTGDDTSPRALLDGAAAEHSPQFSPNGRWLAYVSNESGRREVYVRSYPQGERLPVSTDGGQGPVWSSDGEELFFQGFYEGANSLMVVSVTAEGETLRLGTPTQLFNLRVPGPTGAIVQYGGSNNAGPGFDIFPDGQRFVMSRGPDRRVGEIVIVTNWFEEFERPEPN
ncbi:MAG: PD40 domain-containing protein [Gemmatimonadetes bacterium]|nr:PD40 domain-containing protein [Gemmatimonadota bacterium]